MLVSSLFSYPVSHLLIVSVLFIIQIFKVRTHTNVYKFRTETENLKKNVACRIDFP